MESLEDRIKKFLSVGSGSGDGYGSGYGYGYGSGDGYGDGSGYGYGYGYGSGDGHGDGSGDGYGYGVGSGYGDGYGSGYGSGYGYGDGDGDGSGYGYGYGYGYGSGYGYGYGDLKSYNHQRVYFIDDVPTLIDSVHGMFAQGKTINRDKTLSPCYVARHGNCFAHGGTLKAARRDALAKYMQDMPEEERIEMFVNEHPNLDGEHPCEDLFKWHNTLTGSCEMGRTQFCRDHGISLSEKYTVRYFLDITKNAYGGSVIRKVRERYE